MKRQNNKYVKWIAFMMVFMWLFGAYATNVIVANAEDGNSTRIFGGSRGTNDTTTTEVEEDDAEVLSVRVYQGIQAASIWTPRLQRRDWVGAQGGWTADCNDNGGIARVAFDTTVSLTSPITLGEIFEAFFYCIDRRTDGASSGSDPARHPAPEFRREAFRVFHAGNGYPYLDMRDCFETFFPMETERWGEGYFQYAYVQILHFDQNFFGTGGNINDDWQRTVIMGSFYDRMFVGADYMCGHGYHSLRNFLFPVSATCPANNSTPLPIGEPGHDARGSIANTSQISHPNGFIFGGWFECLDTANALGSQDGRVWERGTGNVTTVPFRTIYARWYPVPIIEKTANPTTLTAAQVAAGATITYTLTVNVFDLPPDLINLEVIDNLSENLTFVPNSLTSNIGLAGITNNSEGNNLRFTIDGLTDAPPDGLIIINFQASVATDTPPGTIGNTATLLGPPPTDGGPRDELGSDEAEVIVQPPIPPPPPPCPGCCDCEPCPGCCDCDCDCDCEPCPGCECDCEPCPGCECDCEPCGCETGCDCNVCDCTPSDCKKGDRRPGAPRTGDLLSPKNLVMTVLTMLSLSVMIHFLVPKKKRMKF